MCTASTILLINYFVYLFLKSMQPIFIGYFCSHFNNLYVFVSFVMYGPISSILLIAMIVCNNMCPVIYFFLRNNGKTTQTLTRNPNISVSLCVNWCIQRHMFIFDKSNKKYWTHKRVNLNMLWCVYDVRPVTRLWISGWSTIRPYIINKNWKCAPEFGWTNKLRRKVGRWKLQDN